MKKIITFLSLCLLSLTFTSGIYGVSAENESNIDKDVNQLIQKYYFKKEYKKETEIFLDVEKVQEYIRDQEREDLMTDSMSTKEYVDPFKGRLGKGHGCQTFHGHLWVGGVFALIGFGQNNVISRWYY